jgi:hypothetical protein
MSTLERVEKLVAVGFCWAHKIGEWKAAIKKHKDSRRPQNS